MWSYYGTKKRISKYYQNPKYDSIIEPFAGAAQYSLFADNWQKNVILYDKYTVVCDIWNWLIKDASSKDVINLPDMIYGQSIDDFKQLSQVERYLIGFSINNASAVPKKKVGKYNSWNKTKLDIAENLHKIKHWKCYNLDYKLIPNQTATWFIDPPYQYGGEWYHSTVCNKHIDYEHLAKWSKSRWGQIIVCENSKANWLPFKPLVELSGQLHKTLEVVFTN